MKNILFVLFFLCCSLVSAKTYYVETTGKDDNPGSISQPWLTWAKAFQTAQAGDTVFFRGGIYYGNSTADFCRPNSGTVDNPICFLNFPGEEPILDFVNHQTRPWQYIFRINYNNYLLIKGLTVRNFLQSAITPGYIQAFFIENSHHIRLENLKVYNIGGPAFGVYGCDEVYVKNCDAWELCDNEASNPGQNGVGFQFNSRTEEFGTTMYDSKIYFEGCRTWRFSDNGFAGSGEGYVEWKDCWAFDGGILNGDGCGWKYSIYNFTDVINPLSRVLINCIAANNGLVGFTPNNGGGTGFNGHYFNNFAFHNGYKHYLGQWDASFGNGHMIYNYSGPNPPNELYLNNIAFANEHIDFWEIGEANDEYNSWSNPSGASVDSSDFLSLDWREMLLPRKPDGSLPDINFGKLAPGSDLIDAGSPASGLPFYGLAPDIGYSEFSDGAYMPAIPVYQYSEIKNITPDKLEITFLLSLAGVTPETSAFIVNVNSEIRDVLSVNIAGTNVILTLSEPVSFGDVVLVSYTQPSVNKLQTPAGGIALAFSDREVSNNVKSNDEQINNNTHILISPNPNNGQFSTRPLTFLGGERNFITIIDMAGRIIYNKIINANEFDISEYGPGLYFFIIRSDNGIVLVEKFVKL